MTETVKLENLEDLDALVAERVMGWTLTKGRNYYGNRMGSPTANKHGTLAGIALRMVPTHSSSIAAAWEVVERMVERNYGKVHISGSHYHGWHAWVAWDDDGDHGSSAIPTQPLWAITAPLAICLAALRAKGVEVEMPTPASTGSLDGTTEGAEP